MKLRPETVEDYAAITELHIRAFGNRTGEALIVALLRQRAAFDAQLSLVAELDGAIVGHVLFTPYVLRLLGEPVHAVNLAPIAVDPARQGQGIGGRLIEAGHSAATEKGHVLSFLLGHPTYYPRFGYRMHAFGDSSLVVQAGARARDELERRDPTEADIAALQALWQHVERAVDFTIEPAPTLLDWLSPNPSIETLVWLRGGVVAGYTRLHVAQPDKPRMFLALDDEAARSMAAALAQRAGASITELVLPLHPSSASAAALGHATARTWEAAMACPLGPSIFDTYFSELRRNARAPGRVLWPSAFDLA